MLGAQIYIKQIKKPEILGCVVTQLGVFTPPPLGGVKISLLQDTPKPQFPGNHTHRSKANTNYNQKARDNKIKHVCLICMCDTVLTSRG